MAASNAVSSQNTPRSGLGSEELEEDDQKPSVQYLDSLNDYRKRSRSKEDEGAAATKLPKIDVPELEPDITDSMMEVNGVDDTPVLGGFSFSTSRISVSSSLCRFAVNGVLKPFSEVTDEDTELMTPDEYTAYYEVLQSRS